MSWNLKRQRFKQAQFSFPVLDFLYENGERRKKSIVFGQYGLRLSNSLKKLLKKQRPEQPLFGDENEKWEQSRQQIEV